MHRGVRTGEEEKRDLVAQHLGGEFEIVLVAQQDGEDVAWEFVFGDFAGAQPLERRAAALHGGQEEFPLEERELFADFLPHRLGIALQLTERGGLAEHPDHVQQIIAFLIAEALAVDAGKGDGEVNHHAVAELDQFETACGGDGRERLREQPRQYLLLVIAQEVAPEDAHFQQPARAVLLAVERDQRLLHQHLAAFVVERLHEIGQRECLLDVGVAPHVVAAHRGALSHARGPCPR